MDHPFDPQHSKLEKAGKKFHRCLGVKNSNYLVM
mgnify:CR=1 FL=1